VDGSAKKGFRIVGGKGMWVDGVRVNELRAGSRRGGGSSGPEGFFIGGGCKSIRLGQVVWANRLRSIQVMREQYRNIKVDH